MEELLSELNSAQRDAATHIDGAMLILAGAGSGKTKTLTTRLAYLISLGIDPASTLTLTFTNKAAKEMRERALSMIDSPIYPPLLCTFHKFGLLFLKFNINRIDRRSNFVLIDSDDKRKIVKDLNDELSNKLIESEISRLKNSLISPQEAISTAEYKNQKIVASTYEKYENFLSDKNLVDFDDLLVFTYKILLSDEELCREISDRYRYIMVDEYQDTNEIQYRILKKLCFNHNNICVVGDDDQSIYGWRGANIRNILDFPDNFSDAKIVKLEENYRSTNQILDVANELISHNRSRHGKNLKSNLGDGKEVEVYESQYEQLESQKVAKSIRKLLDSGVNPNEIAVLFRLNALSRSIEDGLNKERIPFKLVGAVRFYERAEIKDLLSYFRLIINTDDDFSLKRVINRPKRGIGKVTFEKLQLGAFENKKSIYRYFRDCSEAKSLIGDKSYKSLDEYFSNLERLQEIKNESSMKFLDEFENLISFRESYKNSPDSIDRTSNIDEFYGMYRDYVISNPMNGLEDFLNELSLQSDQDAIDDATISCMSIHASKGLEFEYLFVVGLEEGFFPLNRDGVDIEEERRLGYVAFTRAKKELVLSYVKSRNYRGRRTELIKSRFLKEAGLIKGSLNISQSSSYKVGDFIEHKIFGYGRVLGLNKAGKEYKLKINFGGVHREILSSFVKKIS